MFWEEKRRKKTLVRTAKYAALWKWPVRNWRIAALEIDVHTHCLLVKDDRRVEMWSLACTNGLQWRASESQWKE